MRNDRKVLMGVFVAAALAASTSFAQVQPKDAGPRAGAPEQSMRGHDGRSGAHHHGHGRWSNPKAAVEGYLASLKVELKIAPNQENAWQAFAGKARAQADTMIARREKFKTQAQPKQALPAPERLAQQTERMKQRVASMETMTAAVRDLYSVLTPEQKAIADQQLARGQRGGFRGARGGHEGRSDRQKS